MDRVPFQSTIMIFSVGHSGERKVLGSVRACITRHFAKTQGILFVKIQVIAIFAIKPGKYQDFFFGGGGDLVGTQFEQVNRWLSQRPYHKNNALLYM